MKYVIITADDLGLSKEINAGIEAAHRKGILRTSALLMNAPETLEGIKVAQRNPELEIGLHLSIVEGFALSGRASSVTDKAQYFPGGLCLHQDWKRFCARYFTGQIKLSELEEELDLQFRRFLEYFDNIPFVNGTQHMHLLPGVWGLVKKLCIRYKVGAVRLPGLSVPNALWMNKRLPFILPFQALGAWHKRKLKACHLDAPDYVEGMQYAGKINQERLLFLLEHIKHKAVTEIVMHPGYFCQQLVNLVPQGYANFNWEWELDALTDQVVRERLNQGDIRIIQFSDLKTKAA